MVVIKCKMCGGDIELSEDRTYGTCDSCGSTVTLPRINDEQRAAAFNRGEHFRRMGEFDKALAVYERIVQEDDSDAEAHWCCALCRFGIEYVKDPATREYLPTCHRASFDSFLEDVDYLAAVEHSDGVTRRQYQKEAAKIAEVQRDILATSQNEKPFDVFICYKESDENGQRTRDSMLAQDIYYQLTEQGLRVFFARITLEDKPGTQYEPYIFAALNSAKVMVVVSTRPEYVNAVWVKNEWSRFLALMRRDHAKLLIPCYRDMDPYDLPEQLSVLQAYDMGKIGFIQDLIRGVMKVLGKDKKPAPAAEPVVIQQSEGNANVTALLKRGGMALEDGNWADADGYFERALDMDAECAQAYMGKFLVARQCKSLEAFFQNYLKQFAHVETTRETAVEVDDHRVNAVVDKAIPSESAQSDRTNAIDTYSLEQQIEELFTSIDRTYPSLLKGSEELARQGKAMLDSDRQLSRALQFAKGAYRNELQQTLAKFAADLDAQVEEARRADEASIARVRETYAEKLDKAEQQAMVMRDSVLESVYEEACQGLASFDMEKVTLAAFQFDALAAFDYKDSAEKVSACHQQTEAIKTAGKKKIIRWALILVALVVAAILVWVYFKQIVPGNHYKTGEALLQQEDYDGAVAAFEAAGDYGDAAKRIQATHYAKAEALLTQKDYDGAVTAFEAAGDYGDATARIQATYYAKAEALLAQEDYDGAVATFKVAGDYQDAATRIQATYYAKAEMLLVEGQTAAAAMTFAKAGDYQDAHDRSMALWDEIAERKTIAAGSNHTVALKSDGTVVAVGDNDYGQCGVNNWTDIVAVSAGYCNAVGLKSNGTVVAVGYNVYSTCNVSDWTDIVAVSVGDDHTVGLKSDGTVVAVGNNRSGQCDVSDWTDIMAVSAGYKHTMGLKSDGTVVAVGDNSDGQCNVNGWTDIVAVSASGYHTVGLKSDGTVVAVGDDDAGQCDVSDWTDIVAVSAGGYHTVGLKSDGTVVAVGNNFSGQCDASDWTDIVAVSAGYNHTVGLKSDGTVVAVGDNYFGEYNVSDWTDIKLP